MRRRGREGGGGQKKGDIRAYSLWDQESNRKSYSKKCLGCH